MHGVPVWFGRYGALPVLGLAVAVAGLTGVVPTASASAGTSSGLPGVQIFGTGHDFRCIGPDLPAVNRVNPGAAPAQSSPVHLTDSVDGTTASLHAETLAAGGLLLRDVNLVVTEGERVEFSGDLNGNEITQNYGWSGFKSTLRANPTLCIVRFSASSAPVVLIDQFVYGTENYGGIEAIAPAASGAPAHAKIMGTILGFDIVSSQGSPIIETPEANWEKVAGPLLVGMPIGLLSVRGGRFENVTRQHPGIVSADASRNWKAFTGSMRKGQPGILGYVTAWAGDECEMGRGVTALPMLRRLEAEGKLTTSTGGPSGQGLVHAVQGLCRPRQLAEWPARN